MGIVKTQQTQKKEAPKNKPVFKVRVGNVEGAVWEQEGQKGSFLTVSMHRNFKDEKTNEWKQTNSLRINDLPAMQLVLTKCYEYAKLEYKQSSEEQIAEDEIVM